MTRRYVNGRLTAPELVAWAHRRIGHFGPASLQGFVCLHDIYGELEWAVETEADVDRRVDDEAKAFLDGRPSPYAACALNPGDA